MAKVVFRRLLVVLALLLASYAGAVAQTGSPLPSGYLSVLGNQIIDSQGNNVRIASLGYNEPTGNWGADLAGMRALGFNTARYPWYDANMPGILGTMDLIIAAATANNMKVIFDHHGNEATGACPAQQLNGLWYDLNGAAPWNTTLNQDGCGVTGHVTYNQFKANWVTIAQRYAGNSTLIGVDLHNEPLTYGINVGTQGNWGTGNGSDNRLMCSDTGSAINAVNPGVLIICEGVISNKTQFDGTTNAMPPGIVFVDLSGVRNQPVILSSGAPKLVYSIHDYPGSISSANPDSGTTKMTSNNQAWGYLVTGNIAPVWIGELGASLDNANGNQASETLWANDMLAYMNGQKGSLGGPTFTGAQQPISGDWWWYGYGPGQEPDGVLNADGTPKANQKTQWTKMLYTPSTGGGGTPPPNGNPNATTWNGLDKSAAITLSVDLLTATSNGALSQSVRGTTSLSTGKACFDVAATTITADWDVGISTALFDLNSTNGLGGDGNGVGFDPNTPVTQGIFFNNTVQSFGSGGSVSGDVATMCVDFDAKLFWATDTAMRGQGNPWNNSASADPATGTGGHSFAGMVCPCFITFNDFNGGAVATLNAAGPFVVSTPTGFSPWQPPVTSGGRGKFFMFGDAANDNRKVWDLAAVGER